MKKSGMILLMAVALFSVSAHADCQGIGELGCLAIVPFAYTSFITVVPILTSSGEKMEKEAYVAQVHDDAAAYVAADGQVAASAVLQNAIQGVRAQYPDTATLSDLDIAKMLLN